MAGQINFTIWDPKTIDYIAQNSAVIKSVAASKGISAEALAGVMAKENNPYQRSVAQLPTSAALTQWRNIRNCIQLSCH